MKSALERVATERQDAFILVAVADPIVHPEAVHVAAATTRPVVDLTSPIDPAELRRYCVRAAAVLIDAECADLLATLPRHPACYFLTSDRAPMNWEKAMACHAEKAFALPAESATLLAELARAPEKMNHRGANADQRSDRLGLVVSVTGSVGGAGASTFAAVLARAAVRRRITPVTLVDADPNSAGLDLLLGIEDQSGVRWPDVPFTEDAATYDRDDLRAALPSTDDGIAVLSATRCTVSDPFRLTNLIVERACSALRGDGGLVIVDEPRGAVDTAGDCAVIIAPAEVRSAASAAQQAAKMRASRENFVVAMRQRHWSGLDEADMRRVIGTPISAVVPQVAGLARDCEVLGLPKRVSPRLLKAVNTILDEVWELGR